MLLALAALWGASFMFIKIGDRELHPITLVAFRMGLGALTLAPIVLFVSLALLVWAGVVKLMQGSDPD